VTDPVESKVVNEIIFYKQKLTQLIGDKMNTFKQTLPNLLLLAALVLAAIHFSACSIVENPVSPGPADNISGSWKGPFIILLIITNT